MNNTGTDNPHIIEEHKIASSAMRASRPMHLKRNWDASSTTFVMLMILPFLNFGKNKEYPYCPNWLRFILALV